MKKIILLMGMAALMLTACSKSPEERLQALYDDAQENWKNWNQQDWVNFFKEKELIYLDFYESDGTVEEREKLEEKDAELWDSWVENDEDLSYIMAGGYKKESKKYLHTIDMIENAHPAGGGSAYHNDKEADEIFEKRIKAQEEWEKNHKDEINDSEVEATVDELNDESEESDDYY